MEKLSEYQAKEKAKAAVWIVVTKTCYYNSAFSHCRQYWKWPELQRRKELCGNDSIILNAGRTLLSLNNRFTF